MSDGLQHRLTADAGGVNRRQRAWNAKKGWKRQRERGEGEGKEGEEREEGEEEEEEGQEEEEEEEGSSDGGKVGPEPPREAETDEGAAARSGTASGDSKTAEFSGTGERRDEGGVKAVLGLKEGRVPPTCYICRLPLASMCECTAGSLEVER